jgi:hypothetical protein
MAAQPRLIQRLYTVIPKETSRADQVYEDFRNYLQARKSNRDRFAWHTWQIVTGSRAGSLTGGSFGRLIEELDSEQAGNVTDNLAYFFPTAKVEDNAIFVGLPGLGRNPFWEEAPPANFAETRYYRIAPGKEAAFETLLATVREVYAKSRQPRNYAVYRLFNGGPQAVFILWTPLEKLSDMQYPDRGVTAILDALITAPINNLDASAVILATHSELLRYRADLSYTPSA